AMLILAAAALVITAILIALPWATLRLMRAVAQRRRARAVRIVGALCTVWIACAAATVTLPGASGGLASDSAIGMAYHRVNAVRQGIADQRIFAARIARDPLGDTPANCLLSALGGKDVLLIFVESYGRVAVEGSSFAPGVDRVL